jgi:hypothetical protein
MCGATPSFPNTPSWRGAQLKHKDNFNFTFYNKHMGKLQIKPWINVKKYKCNPVSKIQFCRFLGHSRVHKFLFQNQFHGTLFNKHCTQMVQSLLRPTNAVPVIPFRTLPAADPSVSSLHVYLLSQQIYQLSRVSSSSLLKTSLSLFNV